MNEHLSNILSFVRKYHRWRLITLIGNYITKSLFAFLLITFFYQCFFALFPLAIFPLLWDITFILLIIFILSIIIYTLLIRQPSLISTAKIIEKKSDVKHPLVSLAIELAASFNPENELYGEVYRRAVTQLPSLSKITFYPLNKKKICGVLLGIFLVTFFSFLLEPSLMRYWRLPLFEMSKGNFKVLPGTIAVPKFSSVELRLITEGVSTPSSELILNEMGRSVRKTKLLRPIKNGIFSYSIDSIENSFVYYFISNGRNTPPETIEVVPEPYLTALQIELIPPAYSNIKPIKLPFGEGDFTALAGTVARFYLESPHLKTAKILYGGDTITLNSQKDIARGEMIIKESGEYTISLEDTFSQKTETAAKFYIKVNSDEVPFVNFVKPATNKALEPAQQETLFVECFDDFGVRNLEILYFKNEEKNEKPSKIDLSPEKPISNYQKFFVWKILKLSLYPGDTLYYWAKVYDNKMPIPQSATTDTFWFRVPSFEEIHKKIAEREESAGNSLRDVVKGQKELIKNLDNIKRELLSSNKSQ
ncbi:MAG: hypothetical protein N2053_01635, partial [Chitinispirillaceae bacterium]|nr:hypothetical protein [Chitinispirillaceae bacterium]